MSSQVEPGRKRQNPGHANNFDFLRFVLAVAVIFSHSFPLLRGDNAREPLMRLTGGQITAGELAVVGFFILSGFLITKSWAQSPGLKAYLWKRVLRIYPGFLAAIAFCAFVVGPLAAARPSDYWSDFPAVTFVLQGLNLDGCVTPPVFPTNPLHGLNGSLWSIRYEFLCYLGIAALGLTGVLRRPLLVLIAYLGWLAIYAAQVQIGLHMPGGRFAPVYGLPEWWPRLATAFLSGSVFYAFRDRIVYSRRLFAASLVGLALAAALPALKLLVLAVPVLGAYAFFYLGFLPSPPALQNFARRRDLSYGLYLYAFPVQQLLVQTYGTALHPLVLFPAATAVTAVLALLSWTFVEKPFLKLKSKPVSPAATVAAPHPAPPARPFGASEPVPVEGSPAPS